MAYVGARAAGSNVVVICHIDIENQFFGDGFKGAGFAEGFAVARVGAVDGADFETGGEELDTLFAESESRQPHSLTGG